jgi:phage portal protein BeeE
MKDLINTAVIPRANIFIEAFNKQLVPDYGDNLKLEIDKNQIELLQESQNEMYDRVIKAFDAGLLSVGEARSELGKDTDVEHKDAFYMNSGKQIIAADLDV